MDVLRLPVLFAPLTLAIAGFAWGRTGRVAWSLIYGDDLPRVSVRAIRRRLGAGLGLSLLAYLLWIGHLSHWGDCLRANGCEIRVSATSALCGYVGLIGLWLGALRLGFGGVREASLPRFRVDHAGVDVTLPPPANGAATTVMALWCLVPPLGLFSALVALLCPAAPTRIRIDGQAVRVRRGRSDERRPLRGLGVERRGPEDATVIHLTSEQRALHLRLAGTPEPTIERLVRMLRYRAEQAEAMPEPPPMPDALHQLRRTP
ncbi:MAG: hypothetical protein AAGA48_32005 [Myxococcota bacterium]